MSLTPMRFKRLMASGLKIILTIRVFYRLALGYKFFWILGRDVSYWLVFRFVKEMKAGMLYGMADDQVQAANSKPQAPTVLPTVGGRLKEAPFTGVSEGQARGEGVPVVEIPAVPEVEKKLEEEGYIEKVEKEAELAKPVVDDYTQQVLMAPPRQKATPTLPLTEEEVKEGLHHHVWEAIRWLAEWCVRQIKLLHGMVRYKE